MKKNTLWLFIGVIFLIIVWISALLFFSTKNNNTPFACQNNDIQAVFFENISHKVAKSYEKKELSHKENFLRINKKLQKKFQKSENTCELLALFIDDIISQKTEIWLLIYGIPELTQVDVDEMLSLQFINYVLENNPDYAQLLWDYIVAKIQDTQWDITQGLLVNILFHIEKNSGLDWNLAYYKKSDFVWAVANSYYEFYYKKYVQK